MARDLVETPSWPDFITVPEGDDSHIFAADDVASIAQQLANRTAFLRAHSGIIDQANTFADTISVENTDATHAVLKSEAVADDDSHASNKWKLILSHAIGNSGGRMRMYVGTKLGTAQVAFTTNAVWDPATQTWSSDNAAIDSVAIYLQGSTGLQVFRRSAGAGNWGSWPTNKGDVALGGNLTAIGTLHSNGAMSSDAGCTIGGELVYSPTRLRSDLLALAYAQSADVRDTDGSIKTTGSLKEVAIPVRFPPNATPGTVEMILNQATSAPSTLSLQSRQLDWSAPGAPTVAIEATQGSGTSTGYKKVSLSLGSVTLDTAKEYRVLWTPGAAADLCVAMRMASWQDSQLRNQL